jgi:hypothetical protein
MVLNRLHTKRINENRIIDQQHQGEVINLYSGVRMFTVTGNYLSSTPRELCERGVQL